MAEYSCVRLRMAVRGCVHSSTCENHQGQNGMLGFVPLSSNFPPLRTLKTYDLPSTVVLLIISAGILQAMLSPSLPRAGSILAGVAKIVFKTLAFQSGSLDETQTGFQFWRCLVVWGRGRVCVSADIRYTVLCFNCSLAMRACYCWRWAREVWKQNCVCCDITFFPLTVWPNHAKSEFQK
jgi:hypothetical protein